MCIGQRETDMRSVKEVKAAIRETRAEMRSKGIKRTSCFNGGMHGEVYSLNARMFSLETELQTAQKQEMQTI